MCPFDVVLSMAQLFGALALADQAELVTGLDGTVAEDELDAELAKLLKNDCPLGSD